MSSLAMPEISSRESTLSSVMREIFSRESIVFAFSFVLKTVDPGLKIAGVTTSPRRHA